MATKRHLHGESVDDQPESKRDRQNDDGIIIIEQGSTMESEELGSERASSDHESADENEQNSEVSSREDPELGSPVASDLNAAIESDDADNRDGAEEIEEAVAENEDSSDSTLCPQQQAGNPGGVCVSGPKSRMNSPEASAGLQGSPKSHSDPGDCSAGTILQPPLDAPPSTSSSSKTDLEVTQEDAPCSENNRGPEKCSESSSQPNLDTAPCAAFENDIVHILSESRFRSLKVEKAALRRGRPTPVLLSSDSVTDPKTGVTISLSKFTYEKIPWLTGSKTMGKYFCWACLLFSPNDKWSFPGNVGWKESSVAILNHQLTPGHGVAFKTLKQREASLNTLKTISPPAGPPNTPEMNGKIRRFFELLIRIICSKKTNTQNTDMDFDGYEELMKVAISHDSELKALYKKHFSEDGIVDFVSSHAAKLLACIGNIIKTSIIEGITSAPHLSIIYEGTENIVDTVSLIAVIVRYVDVRGEIRERFLKFVKLEGARTTENIYEIHTSLVNKLGLRKKLVGFSYSGTVVKPVNVMALNNSIRMLSPKSKYFHCPDHNLRELLLQSLSHVEQCREFFHVISDLEAFFSCNSGAIPTLLNFVKTSDPTCPWLHAGHSFTHGLISTLKYSYPLVVQFFERVSMKFWNDEVVRQAPEFVRFLKKHKNKFLIALVAAVLNSVDDLSTFMEKTSKPHLAKQAASPSLSKLQSIRKLGVEPFLFTASDPNLCTNDSKFIHPDLPIPLCVELFDGIIDAALHCITQRCVVALGTFHVGSPSAGYADAIKDQTVIDRYTAVTWGIGIGSLKKQIDSFKAYELMFTKKSLAEHISHMTSLGMAEDFSELHRFLRFSLLVAPSKHSLDSTISQLKAYVKDKQRLVPSEVLLYLEKDSISKLLKDGQFVDDVINLYSTFNHAPISPQIEAPVKH